MANRVVIGSQWGDEGKAKVVDFLTLDADIIVRFQGGANAGHTVEVGDKKFVFHLIPSGIMHPDKICILRLHRSYMTTMWIRMPLFRIPVM